MKLFVAVLFFLLVLILSIITWRTPTMQVELAGLENKAREILKHPDHLGAFDGLTVDTEQLDVFLKGTAEREVRDRAIKLLSYGQGKRIPGLPGGLIIDQVQIGNPEPPELRVEAQDLLLSFSGRIPEGGFREQIEVVAKEFPVTPTMSMLKTSRDVGGAEWFAAMPAFLRKFLTGADGASLILTGESLILDRTVADDAARADLLKAARAIVPASISIDDSKLRIAPGLRIRREAEGWLIEGYVPDEASAAFIRQSVEEADPASAGKNQSEKLVVRTGVPSVLWLRRLPTILQPFMAGVHSGAEIAVTGNEVVMQGDVTDLAIANKLQTTAEAGFGAPMVVISKLINANNPLRRLSFDFGKTSAAEIVATGGVPNPQVAKEIEQGLKAAFPSRRIDIRALRVEPAAQTEDWVESLPRFLLEVGLRSAGTGFLKLDVREVSLAGTVPNEITRDALGLCLDWALGTSFRVNNLLTVGDRVSAGAPYEVVQVFFDEGKAEIPLKEQGKLSGLAARLNQPGDRVVLIKAFASKTGTASANAAISTRRSDAVRGELKRVGIQENRMLVQPTGKSGSGGRGASGDRRVELIILE